MEVPWDQSFRDSTQFWVQQVVTPVVVLIGLLGNSVSIHILTRKKMRLSSTVYLTSLTVSDSLFLCFSFLLTMRHYECIKLMEFYWDYLPIGFWFTNAARSTSVWITVSFTIERYIALHHPLIIKHLYNTSKQIKIATLVCTACILLTSPTWLEWRVVTVSLEKPDTRNTNETTFTLENIPPGESINLYDPRYRLAYHWFSTFVFVLIPFVILAIGNVLLIISVRASQKIRQQLICCRVQQQRVQLMGQENHITFTLIFVIITFFCGQLPAAAILLCRSMYSPEKGSANENILFGLEHLSNLLVVINALFNFILYIASSRKYRQVLLDTFSVKVILRRHYQTKYRQAMRIVVSKINVPIESIHRIHTKSAERENKWNVDGTAKKNARLSVICLQGQENGVRISSALKICDSATIVCSR